MKVRSPRRGFEIVSGGVLAIVIAATFIPVLVNLVKDWLRDPNYNHGFLIPIVSGFLIWKRRSALKAAPISPSFVGLAGIVIAGGMFILGTAGAEVFTQRVSLLLLLGSLVVYLYGRRHFALIAFPLAFMLFAIPLPYVVYYGLTSPMQALAAKCAIWGLKGIGVQAVAEGNIIHLPNGSLEVAEACSGIRSLYAFLAFGALVASATSIATWGRIAVFLTTIPLAVAGNAVRVWGSGVSAYLFGLGATKGTVHEMFGLVVFSVSLGVYVLFRRLARSIWPSAASSPPSSSPSWGPSAGSSERAAPQREGSPHSSSSPGR